MAIRPPCYKVYITKEAIKYNTQRSKEKAEYYIHKVSLYTIDKDKEQRVKGCECRTCYYIYGDRISGQAFTTYECGICHKEDRWSNTNHPEICLNCAKENELCCYCGAKLDS
jgi:hypothetical protein